MTLSTSGYQQHLKPLISSLALQQSADYSHCDEIRNRTKPSFKQFDELGLVRLCNVLKFNARSWKSQDRESAAPELHRRRGWKQQKKYIREAERRAQR